MDWTAHQIMAAKERLHHLLLVITMQIVPRISSVTDSIEFVALPV